MSIWIYITLYSEVIQKHIAEIADSGVITYFSFLLLEIPIIAAIVNLQKCILKLDYITSELYLPPKPVSEKHLIMYKYICIIR